nr:type IV secretion system DNA-binding domain-containing protein [Vibrio sp. ABG19]
MQRQELKNANTQLGIKVHPKIPISTAREQNNLCVLGTTGAGKSTALKPIIEQVIERGDYAVIYDEKGDTPKAFTMRLIRYYSPRGMLEVRCGTSVKMFIQNKMPSCSLSV